MTKPTKEEVKAVIDDVDELDKLARETARGFPGLYPGSRTYEAVVERLTVALTRAYEMGRAEENEACASVAKETRIKWPGVSASVVETAIRARRNP